MTTLIMLVLLGTVPVEVVAVDRVEVIELNHFYDEHGKLVFDQLIFYDWDPYACRYQIRAWRLYKSATQHPAYDYKLHQYVATWYDGDSLRQVMGHDFRETWTQYDPELVEREFLPKEKRRELSPTRRIKP